MVLGTWQTPARFALIFILSTLALYLRFLMNYPNRGIGDTVKATYMLQAYPFVALLVGDRTVLSVDGDTLTDESVTFLSSDGDIVSVAGTGLVTAEGSGTATITARADDRSAMVTVYVRRAASISVAPSSTSLVVDDTLRLTATVLDAGGAPLAFAVVRWFDDYNADALRHDLPQSWDGRPLLFGLLGLLTHYSREC